MHLGRAAGALRGTQAIAGVDRLALSRHHPLTLVGPAADQRIQLACRGACRLLDSRQAHRQRGPIVAQRCAALGDQLRLDIELGQAIRVDHPDDLGAPPRLLRCTHLCESLVARVVQIVAPGTQLGHASFSLHRSLGVRRALDRRRAKPLDVVRELLREPVQRLLLGAHPLELAALPGDFAQKLLGLSLRNSLGVLGATSFAARSLVRSARVSRLPRRQRRRLTCVLKLLLLSLHASLQIGKLAFNDVALRTQLEQRVAAGQAHDAILGNDIATARRGPPAYGQLRTQRERGGQVGYPHDARQQARDLTLWVAPQRFGERAAARGARGLDDRRGSSGSTSATGASRRRRDDERAAPAGEWRHGVRSDAVAAQRVSERGGDRSPQRRFDLQAFADQRPASRARSAREAVVGPRQGRIERGDPAAGRGNISLRLRQSRLRLGGHGSRLLGLLSRCGQPRVCVFGRCLGRACEGRRLVALAICLALPGLERSQPWRSRLELLVQRGALALLSVELGRARAELGGDVCRLCCALQIGQLALDKLELGLGGLRQLGHHLAGVAGRTRPARLDCRPLGRQAFGVATQGTHLGVQLGGRDAQLGELGAQRVERRSPAALRLSPPRDRLRQLGRKLLGDLERGERAVSSGARVLDLTLLLGGRGGRAAPALAGRGQQAFGQLAAGRPTRFELLCLGGQPACLRTQLGKHVADALEVRLGLAELCLRLPPTPLVAAHSGGFLEQRAALLGAQRERLVDHALADEQKGVVGQVAGVQQLDEIPQPDPLPIEQVLALA